MTHGKTYNKSPCRINHKATKSKTNNQLKVILIACSVDVWHLKKVTGGRSVVIGGTVGLVSSIYRASDLQAGGRGFDNCIRHNFSSLVYFNGDEVN